MGVSGIPALFVIRDGKVIGQTTGAMPTSQIVTGLARPWLAPASSHLRGRGGLLTMCLDMLPDDVRLPDQHWHGDDARLHVVVYRQAGRIDLAGVQQPIEERRLAGPSLEGPGKAGAADGDGLGDSGIYPPATSKKSRGRQIASFAQRP